MSTLTLKEWAAEYRRINEAEFEDLKRRLPQLSVEESTRAYFRLCQLLAPYAVEAEQSQGLRELRSRHYQELADKWRRLARRRDHAARP